MTLPAAGEGASHPAVLRGYNRAGVLQSWLHSGPAGRPYRRLLVGLFFSSLTIRSENISLLAGYQVRAVGRYIAFQPHATDVSRPHMDEVLDFLRLNGALIVSTCALVLTITNASATRLHNRLTVQPRLSTFTNRNTDPLTGTTGFVEVRLSNNGLGPAIIDTFTVLLNGKPTGVKSPEDLYSVVVQTLGKKLVVTECQFGLLRNDYVLAKDETVTVAKILYQLPGPPELLKEFERFHLHIAYKSAYGEPFVYDSRIHTDEPKSQRIPRGALMKLWTSKASKTAAPLHK
jgi:hypothetical protein